MTTYTLEEIEALKEEIDKLLKQDNYKVHAKKELARRWRRAFRDELKITATFPLNLADQLFQQLELNGFLNSGEFQVLINTISDLAFDNKSQELIILVEDIQHHQHESPEFQEYFRT